MEDKQIKLYHGGREADLVGLFYSRFNRDRPFFLTPDLHLAEEASRIYIPYDGVLLITLPLEVYKHNIETGNFIERPYFGVIQFEGGREVKVLPGEGIDVLDQYLPFRY